MKKDEDYYYWDKSEAPQWLSNYFKTNEFSCKCDYEDCIQQKISVSLIDKLGTLRLMANSPMSITSGFRCAKKQKDIADSGESTVVAKRSAHEDGNAADVRTSAQTPLELYNLAKINNLFINFGIARSFMHLDVRPPKADGSGRLWYYY